MERMRLGADDTSISDPDPEFDPDDPEYMRFAYTGGFTLSVFGASTGSAGYSVEEEGVDLYISIALLAWSLARSDEIDLSAIAVKREILQSVRC